jgi:predicted DNA-binding transcriptional regulator AlpA
MSDHRHYLITWPQLEAQVPFVRQTVGRLEQRGEFPQRVQVGPNRVAWWQDEVDAWLAARTRGAPPQHKQLGPKSAPPEPDAEDVEVLRRLAAKLGLDLVPKPERRRRSGSGP